MSDMDISKIADCFLSYTLPIYCGCTNLGDYFPSKSFVEIDINDYQKSCEIIQEVLEQGIWQDRLEAIKEARELVLNKYQLFPFIANIVNKRKDRFHRKEHLSLGNN